MNATSHRSRAKVKSRKRYGDFSGWRKVKRLEIDKATAKMPLAPGKSGRVCGVPAGALQDTLPTGGAA
jgi:hypothetical protein